MLMTQAMTFPGCFTFVFHQHIPFCPVPRSKQVSDPHTTATDPAITIDLAKRAQLSRQYAHLIWTGQRQITRKMARRIEAAAGIPYADLMTAEPLPRKPGAADEPAPGRQP
jgi:hypothetical protein